MVGGDSDGFTDRGDATGARACRTGVGQSRFGILVEEQAGRHQVPRHRVGGAVVQSREFAADLGRQLLGLDLGGDWRTVVSLRRRCRAWVAPDGPGWDPKSVAAGAAGPARRCRRFRPEPRLPFYPIDADN